MRSKRFGRTLSIVLAASMVLSSNVYAAGIKQEAAAKEQQATAEKQAVKAQDEELADEEQLQEESVTEEQAKDGEGYKYDIEINQGFSLHVQKDQDSTKAATYISDFVADKATAIMVPVDAADEAAAKTLIQNWSLTAVDSDGKEGFSAITADKFTIKDYYDEDSNVVSGKKMAVASLPSGPSKGKYTFTLKDGDTVVAESKNIDFYETKKLSLLAVPVTAYYSKSANTNDDGTAKLTGGGCPKDMVEKPVECEATWNGQDLWNNIDKTLTTYLKDVYPIADLSIEIGQTVNAGTAEYDMCTSDGQKKLWEECNKLQVKDKETGKDKYDLILAFVMYRQDEPGTGQGYTYGSPTNIITLTDADMLPTVAHEIAHCYQVGDEYSGGSYNYRVNNTPLGYTDKARDKVTGDEVTDSTEYTKNGGVSTDNYYWLSGKQYKESKAGATVSGKAKENIDENGSGSVIYPSLHPYKLSTDEFVHYAESGDTVYPTLSYMGSGYSGNDNYYWTTTVIWDHLFKEFMVKEKKAESSESGESGESGSESQAAIAEDSSDDWGIDDDDLYYDEEYREGESRMIEVSGYIDYESASENAKVKDVDMDPMFSYEGDLSFIEYMTEKEIEMYQDEDIFVFAALDESGKIIKSPVDGEEATVEFYGGNFNSATPAPKHSGDLDKRYQDFCSFDFDAEFPKGTDRLVIMKWTDYDNSKTKTFAKGDSAILWDKEVPDKEIEGYLYGASLSKNNVTVDFAATAYDSEDKATTDNLYTIVYYAPQGDDGELYYVTDGDYEKDFGGSGETISSVSFDPNEFPDKITDKAYVWIKVSDGVNGADIFSDQEIYKGGVSDNDVSAEIEPSYKNVAEIISNKVTKEAVSVAQNENDTALLLTDFKKGNAKTLTVTTLDGAAAGEYYLTVNAKTTLWLPGGDYKTYAKNANGSSKGILSATDGLEKKAAGVSYNKKKGSKIATKAVKGYDSYGVTISDGDYTFHITIMNISFNKDIKKKTVSALDGAVVITPLDGVEKGRIQTGVWMVAKTIVTEQEKSTEIALDNKGHTAKVTVLKDGAISLDSIDETYKGNIKLTYYVNGKKYSTAVKVNK